MEISKPKKKSKKWLYIVLFITLLDLIGVLIFLTPISFLPHLTFERTYDDKSFERITEESKEDLKLIKQGNQKVLIKNFENPKWSICYIHGFTASPQELEPVVSNLAQQLQANLFMTRLTGHGLKDASPMAKVKAQDWLNDAMDCFNVAKSMGQKTILMGTSFGGTLSVLVTAYYHLKPDALILISPNLGLQNPMAFLLAGTFGQQIARLNFGKIREYKTENEAHKQYWSYRHPSAALKPFMILTRKVEEKQFDPSLIVTPTYIVFSEQDEVVSVEKMKQFYEKMNPEVKGMFTTPVFNKHVLAGDALNPEANLILRENIYNFIQGLDESI